MLQIGDWRVLIAYLGLRSDLLCKAPRRESPTVRVVYNPRTMPLQSGAKFGPYEIATLIGAGGMGEVYRGRDTRLDRIVAIKVLPAHLAEQPELRERFEREARAVAALNHPH